MGNKRAAETEMYVLTERLRVYALHLAAGYDVATATGALKSGCGWADPNSYLDQAFLKFPMSSITWNV